MNKPFSWITATALTLLGSLVLVAVLAPWLAPHDPTLIDLGNRLAASSAEHWLGTDHLGRDVLSRLMHGTALSLGATLVTLVLIVVVGIAVGGFSALLGGRVDQIIMRVCDVFMTFPTVVFALFLIAVLGTGLTNVIVAIALTHWAWYARIVRGLVLSLKNSDYLRAAKACGAGPAQRFFRHLLPSVMVQIVVLASLDIGHIMLHVSGLSFLGLGVQPPTPEWGVMISDARQFIWTNPSLILWPGLAILVSVMALNILGDALRDRLDPGMEH